MGDGTRVKVECFGIVKLKLSTGNFLELVDVAYVPSIRRNLISVSLLDKFGYSVHFEKKKN